MGRNFTSPVKPMSGQVVKADHMQNHARAIEELQRVIIPAQKKGQSRRGSSLNLYLTPAGLDGSGDYLTKVTSGYVNGQMPTLGGTALNAATPPTIVVDADKYIWLKCVGTFGSPDTYVFTIVTEATATPPTGTTITSSGFVSFFNIGYATFNATGDATLTPIHSGGNLGVDSFGAVNLWWKT